jgi:hypothetical protein
MYRAILAFLRPAEDRAITAKDIRGAAFPVNRMTLPACDSKRGCAKIQAGFRVRSLDIQAAHRSPALSCFSTSNNVGSRIGWRLETIIDGCRVNPRPQGGGGQFENLILFWSRGIHKASSLKASSHFFQKAINLCG